MAEEEKITIGIIGNGRFGGLLYQIFTERWKDAEVKMFSRREKADNIKFFEEKEVWGCNIVIPCVPISEFEAQLSSHSSFLKPHSLLIDVCSVKVHPAEVMLNNVPDNIDILATHPMFGPDSTKNGTFFEGLKFIFSQVRIQNTARCENFLNFWKNLGCEMIEMTPEEHDKQAAYTHAFAFLIGKIGIKLGVRKNQITTKGFEGILYNQVAVENDTGQLFKDMMMYNPFTKEMRKKVKAALDEIENDLK